MIEITKSDIANTLTSFLRRADEELFALTEEELTSRWYWKWDSERSVQWNTYQFYEMLYLYKQSCRKWEEHHNGSCCVVERVREKYLMPKINEFLVHIKNENSNH